MREECALASWPGENATAIQPSSGVGAVIPRVLVTDTRQLFREGLAHVLARQDGVVLVAATGDGDDAVHATRHLRPDIVVVAGPLELRLEASRRLAAGAPGVKVLFLAPRSEATPDDDPSLSGVAGLIPDTVDARELASVLVALHRGETPTPGSFVRFGTSLKAPLAATNGNRLTEQETRVLARLAGGARNDDIARSLGISRDTVKAHLKHIFRKLNVRSRTEAAVLGLRWGLVAENGSQTHAAAGTAGVAGAGRKKE